MGQVRLAISPARRPALAESSTMTALRRGCRVAAGVDEQVLNVCRGKSFGLSSLAWYGGFEEYKRIAMLRSRQ